MTITHSQRYGEMLTFPNNVPVSCKSATIIDKEMVMYMSI